MATKVKPKAGTSVKKKVAATPKAAKKITASGIIQKVASVGSSLKGGATVSRGGARMGRRRRMTPQKLMNRILILKLKKKLMKLQYGGR